MNQTEEFINNYESKFIFNTIDYTVFILVLSISASVGIYFGFFKKGANTTDEYLLGSKQMKTLPIAISLIASQLSGISVMTIPAEMYSFGTTYSLMVPAMMFVLPILCFIVVPIFYNNNISNCYEYLEMRFDKKTRQLVTLSFIVTIYLILPVIVFIPALAFSQVTGINIHLINGIVCAVCVFYTMLGGIKAVVWTDVIQAAIMFISVIFVACVGTYQVGGVAEVFNRANDGGRLNMFNMKLDLTTRATFWNCLLTGITMWTGYVGLNQSCVQRIVALPSLAQAKRALAIFGIGFFIIMFFNCSTGIIMYAHYFNCDPVRAGVVQKADKLIPFFIQDVIGHLKGMPGLFISCVFSAALSTMSANLNSMSGIVYFDYVRPYITHTEARANLIMKILVTITGMYCVVAGIVVEKFTSILQMVITISGISQGSVVGVFFLGMLYPKSHSKAAFWATVMSMLTMAWIVIGTQFKIAAGELNYTVLPTSVENCDSYNITVVSHLAPTKPILDGDDDDSFSIYKTSFNWYALIGAVSVWLYGLPLCYLLENNDKKLRPNLISSLCHSFIPKELQQPEEVPLRDECEKVKPVVVTIANDDKEYIPK